MACFGRSTSTDQSLRPALEHADTIRRLFDLPQHGHVDSTCPPHTESTPQSATTTKNTMRNAIYWLAIALLVFSSCANTGSPLSPQVKWYITICRNNVTSLPASCVPGDQLTEQNGGIINLEVFTRCGIVTCTWACISKKNDGPFFAIKHWPWSLCQLCFSSEPLPKNCYQEPKPRQSRHPAIPVEASLMTHPLH